MSGATGVSRPGDRDGHGERGKGRINSGKRDVCDEFREEKLREGQLGLL